MADISIQRVVQQHETLTQLPQVMHDSENRVRATLFVSCQRFQNELVSPFLGGNKTT